MLKPTNCYVIFDRHGSISVAHWLQAAGGASGLAASDQTRPQLETELTELETLYALIAPNNEG